MTHEEFKKFVEKFHKNMQDIMRSKNPDYSAGTDDALYDYYSAAKRYNVTPIQAWAVLFNKHIHAIERFIKHQNVCSEPIEGRFLDAANYLILGAALVSELQGPAYGSLEELELVRSINDVKGVLDESV